VKLNLRPGLIVVTKSTVFLEPKTHHTNVTSEVVEEWLRNKQTLAEGVEIMAVTTTTNAHEVYTQMDLGAAKSFVDYARE
jgi:hypothetical protein